MKSGIIAKALKYFNKYGSELDTLESRKIIKGIKIRYYSFKQIENINLDKLKKNHHDLLTITNRILQYLPILKMIQND